ncbi:RrF2 family transcriptional regulator [Candidatus Latescibacterota bacterium]
MSGLLNVSEATALAVHSMMYLETHRDRKVSTREIAVEFSASEAHLAKVMQRLVKAGLVGSIRGPKGGFNLKKPGKDITLYDLYELFEGPVPEHKCLFHEPVCLHENCAMNGFLDKIHDYAMNYMTTTSLIDIAQRYRKGINHDQKNS